VAFLALSPQRSEARFRGIFESGLTGSTNLAIVYRAITNKGAAALSVNQKSAAGSKQAWTKSLEL
jgi:hypothetical protein